MAYGAMGYLGISAQQNFGTATTSYVYFPIKRETLATQVEMLFEQGLRNRFEKGPLHSGMVTIQGEIEFEPDVVTLGHIFRGVLGQASSTAVAATYFSWVFINKETDFSTDCAFPPFSIIIGRNSSDTASAAVILSDCVFTGVTINDNGGEIVNCTVNVLGRTINRGANVTPSYGTLSPLMWETTSISIAGAANATLESATIKIDNPVEGIRLLDNTSTWGKFKRNGQPTFELSGVTNFDDYTEYGKFINTTEQRVIINISGANSMDALYFDFPNLVYKTYPVNVAGPNRVTVSWTGEGIFNTTSSYALEAKLTNTMAGYTP